MRTCLSQSPRPCYFIGTLSQTLTLRAAFMSSTYLLSQIPGPACLNPPNPLFKGAHQAYVRTRAHGHRFAVLRPASDDALLNLIPPTPFSRGRSGPTGFPSPRCLGSLKNSVRRPAALNAPNVDNRSHCGRQQGCPCGDLPPSVLEGGAREAGGPGPHRGFLLPYTPGVQAAQRVSYRLSII